MITILSIVSALFLLIIAFLIHRKSFSQGEYEDEIDPLPGTASSTDSQPGARPSDNYKCPEFEYTCLDDSISLIDGENMAAGLSHTLRQKIKTVTPVTSAAFEPLKLLDTPGSKGEQIAAVVATAPVFSSHVLKTVNSARFNLPSKVNCVGTAILVMGYHEFKKMVMAYDLKKFLPNAQDEFQLKAYNDLWLHSALVSTCAAYLGQNVFHRYEQELGTIGLLHDVGKNYLPLLKKKRPTAGLISSCIEEDAAYGFNHAILSSYVAQECNLSDTIVNAVYYHHHPQFFLPEKIPMDYRLPSFILCIADLICKAYGYHGKGKQIYPIREEYFEMYDIDLKSIFSKKLEMDLNRCRFTVESFMKS